MGLSIEQQRELIRAKKKDKGEIVSVGKVHRVKSRKKKIKKVKQSKKNKSKKVKTIPDYKKKYNAYLLSNDWAQLKIDLFNHRGYSCEKCPTKNGLHVHHLHYDNIFKEEPEDLIILCAKCHRLEHKRLKKGDKGPVISNN